MKTQRREGAFRGFGRVPAQPHGSFRFKAFKPASVPAPDGTLQAPHLAVFVFTRELLCRLVTRIYFPDEPSNAEDFAFKLVEAGRRRALIAKNRATADWNVTWCCTEWTQPFSSIAE